MRALAPRQQEVYQAVRAYWREVGRAPSFKDLEARLNMTGTPLRRHIEILEERGYLAPRRPNTPRDIYLTTPEAA